MSFFAAERPVAALGPARVEMIRDLPDLAIVAIAGRDSIAAAVTAVREHGFTALQPTSVATSTEYGDTDAPLEAVALLRETLGDEADVLDPIRIGSPRLWAALNGRFAGELLARYGIASPCLACHLYVHLARVPLSWALGMTPVVTGERDTHDGRLKLSQTAASIDAEVRVLARAGVELLTPVRQASTTEVAEVVPGWANGTRELECVHAGNYRALDGSVSLPAEPYGRYLAEFFEPAGLAVVEAWRSGTIEPDYAAIVAGVLDRAHSPVG